MRLRPRKGKHCSEDDVGTGRDRLSELPDEVIVQILSCLPTIDAVRTVLLRRFGNLWTFVHSLYLECPEFNKRMFPKTRCPYFCNKQFCIFVHNVLVLHKSQSIEKFLLHVSSDVDEKSCKAVDYVNTWLKFALDKQAKEMIIRNGFGWNSIPTDFTSQSLVTLELKVGSIKHKMQVDLGSLKKLVLAQVHMSEETFLQFISGCPSLQELDIDQCYYHSHRKLSFNAPNIRRLSLGIRQGYDTGDCWVLDFPNIKSLVLQIDRIPVIIDVSSLQDFYLKYMCPYLENTGSHGMFKMFFEKFKGVEVFQLSRHASESFLHRIHIMDDLHLLQIRWKRLVLGLYMLCDSCLLGICELMSNLKHVEEIIIYTTTELTSKGISSTSLSCHEAIKASLISGPVESSAAGCVMPSSAGCIMPELNTVTLHGYVKPWNHQLQLVEFLLKSATVLDKLVIVPKKRVLTERKELEFVKQVTSFQRASTRAKVLFA